MKFGRLAIVIGVFVSSFSLSLQNDVQAQQALNVEASQQQIHRKIRELELKGDAIARQAAAMGDGDRIQSLRLEIAGLEIEKELNHLHEKLARLDREQYAAEGSSTERSSAGGNSFVHEHQELLQKIEHIDIASKHLHEAGLDEYVERLSHHRRELEQQIHQSDESRAAREPTDHEFQKEVAMAIRQLQSAVHELQQEVARMNESDRD